MLAFCLRCNKPLGTEGNFCEGCMKYLRRPEQVYTGTYAVPKKEHREKKTPIHGIRIFSHTDLNIKGVVQQDNLVRLKSLDRLTQMQKKTRRSPTYPGTRLR